MGSPRLLICDRHPSCSGASCRSGEVGPQSAPLVCCIVSRLAACLPMHHCPRDASSLTEARVHRVHSRCVRGIHRCYPMDDAPTTLCSGLAVDSGIPSRMGPTGPHCWRRIHAAGTACACRAAPRGRNRDSPLTMEQAAAPFSLIPGRRRTTRWSPLRFASRSTLRAGDLRPIPASRVLSLARY